jgi:Fe-Mn family superoxide dismutase
MTLNRRHFLFLLGATTGSAALGIFPAQSFAQSISNKQEEYFKVLPLPYAYDALEPHIDAETMRFHHDKHYVAYTKNLNAAINQYPELKGKTIEELLSNLNQVPKKIRTTVQNNGGGYLNHTMFWQIMSPKGGGKPTGEIASAIEDNFGSFAAFQEAFNQAGSSRFGSGWAWLVLDKKGKLQVISTANQDSPLMQGLQPIMGNDVWEHAYYLKYKNNRGEYLKNWWNVVNWEEINKRFLQAKA